MEIYTGTSNPKLSIKVSNLIFSKYGDGEAKSSLHSLKIEKFSDGEILPKFNKSVREKEVIFIQSLTSAHVIMETLLTCDAAKRAGCKNFTLVSPYLGYSRQDKIDHLRAPIGSKLLADILEKSGIMKLITIDLHASSIQGFYNIPVIHINGNRVFIDYIKSLNLENICLVAPDQGAIKKVSDFHKAFPESSFSMINKKRIKPNEVHSMELMGSVYGKNVVLLDDICDTGGTLSKASDLLLENGAQSVRAICTHGLLSGKGLDTIKNSSLTELIVSDSIESSIQKSYRSGGKIKVISCDKILSDIIWAVSKQRSINEINQI